MTIFFNLTDGSLVAMQYKNIHKIKLNKDCISIYYYDGSFNDLGGFACPKVNNVRLHYINMETATKKMQDFYSCLAKNSPVFKF